MLQAVKTLITVDLMAEHVGDVAKAVTCNTSVIFSAAVFPILSQNKVININDMMK